MSKKSTGIVQIMVGFIPDMHAKNSIFLTKINKKPLKNENNQ